MILVKNVYYMLSYVFDALKQDKYKKIELESFDNVSDLCAEILITAISSQIKQGLNKSYIREENTLSSVRGKINITESIKSNSILKKQLVCSYDEFSVNSYMNQIIKTTVYELIKTDIGKDKKKALKKLMVFFNEVDILDKNRINWRINYNRNNQTYRLLISICWLIMKGLLHTEQDGSVKMMNFLSDKSMAALYEKFILKYYRKHHGNLSSNKEQIEWQLDDGFDDLLPKMETDITLSKGNKVLIIDAKFYKYALQYHFDSEKLVSNNLYQIFAYVKNKEYELRNVPHEVSGMLLYAKTDEDIHLNHTYMMSGNKISVKMLDLNQEFSEISKQLDNIANNCFSD
ncbi:MAG: 5-methylcytosine-specific restriction endonuclease system specificity protein McrC [Erysipelotrichaceae bacterium]|nr:5-methylcytosine-specific restriction endonuclease system specificity protein McrC [Erysipelotrichaceae bacterium]